MRLVALASERPPAFDIHASEQLLLQVAYRGIAIGIVFIAVRRFLPRAGAGGWQFGVLLLVVMLAAALLTPWRSEFQQGPLSVGLALFALVFFVFGWATSLLTIRLESALVRVGRGLFATCGLLLVSLLGMAAGLIGLLSILFKDLVAGS